MKRAMLTYAVLLVCLPLFAQEAATPPANMETYMVAMRDGVKLATDVYLPEGTGPLPCLLARSVYGRGMKDFALESNARGYAFVIQDARGKGDSEGEDNVFYPDGWRPEVQDGADTVAWIVAQPWSNGKIGTLGGSALGITQVLMAPATREVDAQFIEVAPADLYHDNMYQGGVWKKNDMETWLGMQKLESVRDLWKSHPTYDEFWAYFNAEAKVADVTAPAIHVGGWYDMFQQGTIKNFLSRQHRGGPGARDNQILIMKWSAHGPDNSPDYTLKQNRIDDMKVSRYRDDFFAYWLKGESNGIMDGPAVFYYTMGDDVDPKAPGSLWRTANDWPPLDTEKTEFFLNVDDKSLTPEPPSAAAAAGYAFDPAKPVETRGGHNLTISMGPWDQRPVNEGRADVLRLVTAPLTEPVEATGQVWAELYVSTDAPDTDFVVRLVDVFPDGREILILDGIQRVKFREGYEKPLPLLTSAEEIVKLSIDMWSLSWIFNTGHRIGLLISSSSAPRFEVNPNTGEDHPGDPSTYRIAQNTVHASPAHPSALILPLRDASRDDDGDGLPTRVEWARGLNPDKADSDGDGVADGDEPEVVEPAR